jgi:apolipoprotein N-acyltransferase
MSSTAIYHGSNQSVRELLAVARFRAAENSKPLILAANMGLSYAINSHGKILNIASNENPQILTGSVDFSQEKSWYNRCGDWPVLLASGLGLLILFFIKKFHVKQT